MDQSINRRSFLRVAGAAGAGIGAAALNSSPLWAADAGTTTVAKLAGASNVERLGWRLGCQAYSFRKFTFFEAIDKTASLGLHYIEAFPGQKLAKNLEGAVNEGLSADARKAIKQKLSESNVKLVNYGVCNLYSDAEKSRKVFEFAKDMGIETIVSEPPEDAFDLLDKLAAEYGINVAVHNHPRPSHYWNPDKVLKVCEGRSKRIGSCADTGHWMRSGLNPIECLKKLNGRLLTFHFKDLNEAGPKAHDVPWGKGVCDVKGMLKEIYRQGVKAVYSIEYERNWDNSVPEIAQCVAYFDKMAIEIGAPKVDGPPTRRR